MLLSSQKSSVEDEAEIFLCINYQNEAELIGGLSWGPTAHSRKTLDGRNPDPHISRKELCLSCHIPAHLPLLEISEHSDYQNLK